MKIGMVITMQTDLEKAVLFYKRLGLHLRFHLEEKWAEFEAGGVKFGLCPTKQKQDNIRTGIVLETEQDIKQLYTELKEEGVHFFGEPVEAVHGIMVGLKDPSGNVLDLYQPTPERVQELARKVADKDEAAQKSEIQSCADISHGCKTKQSCCKDEAADSDCSS